MATGAAAAVAEAGAAAVRAARAGADVRALVLLDAVERVAVRVVLAGATVSEEMTSTGAGALVSGTPSAGGIASGALLVGWDSVVEAGTS